MGGLPITMQKLPRSGCRIVCGVVKRTVYNEETPVGEHRRVNASGKWRSEVVNAFHQTLSQIDEFDRAPSASERYAAIGEPECLLLYSIPNLSREGLGFACGGVEDFRYRGSSADEYSAIGKEDGSML
jgi:hypothetical protein